MAPVYGLILYTGLFWAALCTGLLALAAAWVGGQRSILSRIRVLLRATDRLAAGDLSCRTGMGGARGELGDLARKFDALAAKLQERVQEREQVEKNLLNRSLQQTVVSALGQFALVSTDFSALLNQVVMLVSQTLEVEYCEVLELTPEGDSMLLRAGAGWIDDVVGTLRVPADASTQSGYTLWAGEPVVVEDLGRESRFAGSRLLAQHGVVSGMTVPVSGHGRTYGVLGAHTTNRRLFNEDEVHFLLAVATVLAMAVERTQAEAQLQKLASFAQLNPNPAMEIGADGTLTYWNEAARKLAASVSQPSPRSILPPDIPDVVQHCLADGHDPARLESTFGGRTLSWSFHPVPANRVVHAYVEDITERLSLEAQLRQAQKMESVGQLAAGVAHDFNNMLTVIEGHSGLLLAKPDLPPELKNSAQAVFFAAERAANLTRQLLMFSRKNIMQSKPLNLREVVGQLSKMLERLLGETITLDFCSPPRLPLVRADAGMIEQVLMNLAVNARDAMPKGGILRIHLLRMDIGEDYARAHAEARPGCFVRLRVADTGCGMDPATRSRIFEPFFTTKEVGKGTGLGLATVYGIVKQHEGWIELQSEVGQGTTFEVFLPACTETAGQAQSPAPPSQEAPRGLETILIVEDEPVLRELARVILEECGYKILEAESGLGALRVWDQHRGAIDLLLTDMVMPDGLSGMELAKRLRAAKPSLRIIFASGYSMDELDASYLQEGRAAFLQKPYTHLSLAKAVRNCLDG
jgi:signal transduction histidine kinase/HAMP domain-containing protein